MKAQLTFLIFILSGTNFAFAESNSSPDFNRLSKVICAYIQNDYTTSIRKRIYASKINLRDSFNKLNCQSQGSFKGGNLMQAARYYGSVNAESLFTNYIPDSQLAYTYSQR